MATLRILNARGHEEISWSTAALASDDPEACAAVREAERIFARERALGATAFRVTQGAPAERLDVLDPMVEADTVLIPQVAGG